MYQKLKFKVRNYLETHQKKLASHTMVENHCFTELIEEDNNTIYLALQTFSQSLFKWQI